jgi:prophage regulatory protein
MEILRIKEVAKKTALSPASIYKQIRLGNFPKGTKITARATGWSSEVVEAWIATKLSDEGPSDSHAQALSRE